MSTKQTEALKLALEALKKTQDEGYNLPGTAIREAITAIREALAEQPAQQQQGPVACKTLCELCVKRGYHFCANAAQPTPIPSPPASKPWVGLTKEDRYKAIRPLYCDDATAALAACHSNDEYEAIEAKLREKNA